MPHGDQKLELSKESGDSQCQEVSALRGSAWPRLRFLRGNSSDSSMQDRRLRDAI